MVNIFNGRYFQTEINPFPVNVPFIKKPGNWFSLAKCVKKHLWMSDILTKDAGHCHSSTGFLHTWNIGTLARNGLKTVRF